jgi:hypothetical protein
LKFLVNSHKLQFQAKGRDRSEHQGFGCSLKLAASLNFTQRQKPLWTSGFPFPVEIASDFEFHTKAKDRPGHQAFGFKRKLSTTLNLKFYTAAKDCHGHHLWFGGKFALQIQVDRDWIEANREHSDWKRCNSDTFDGNFFRRDESLMPLQIGNEFEFNENLSRKRCSKVTGFG